MDLEIERIFLTDEFDPESETEEYKISTDAIIQFNSGDKYIASFITFEGIDKIRLYNQQKGLFLNGKYFWMNHMLLIDKCSVESIRTVVRHLLDEGNFLLVFEKL